MFWTESGRIGAVKTLYFSPLESCAPAFPMLFCNLTRFRASAVAELPLLTAVRQVGELSPDQAAQGYRVCLRGVVTFCDAEDDVGLFLQDATAGIFVKLGEGTNVNAGDEAEIEGATKPGDYVPIVIAEHVRVLGRAALPTPGPDFGCERLAIGKEDCQWIEVHGVVRPVIPMTKDQTDLDMIFNGQQLTAQVEHLDMAKSQELVCGTVRILGFAEHDSISNFNGVKSSLSSRGRSTPPLPQARNPSVRKRCPPRRPTNYDNQHKKEDSSDGGG
jgi:hypothetical protein